MHSIKDFIIFSLLSFSSLSTLSHGLKLGNESDYEALLAIKDHISDDPDSVLSSWSNSSLHFCQWRGVTCGRRHSRVVGLYLSSNKLAGTLSPFIGNLSFLRELELFNNFFRGDIPHQISHLPRLRILDLQMNSFGGKIPANLSRCRHLMALGLSNNNLEGRIPTEVATMPNLVHLNLFINHFSGLLKDIGIGNMSSSLQVLQLAQNQLQGSIPDDFGKLKGLTYLSLSGNMLSGVIPTSIFNLSSLTVLEFSRNIKITGNLPQDLGLRLHKLQTLLASNTSLVGRVPNSLSNLSELQTLDLSVNSFKGEFSFHGNNMPDLKFLNIAFAFSPGQATDLGFIDTLTNCTSLMNLQIHGNSFTGPFPHSVLNLSTTLQFLVISKNQISGYVPLGLGRFVNLIRLVFEDNLFTGPIPADISKLQHLEVAGFSNNSFSGEIPFSLGNMTRLSALGMAYNNLEGSLPSVGNCTYLEYLDLYSNKFSGVLPLELFHASSLVSISINKNSLQGSLPDQVSMPKNLVRFDVSNNRFSGEIPSSLGGCTSLRLLYMNGNTFVGSIPKSLGSLKSIEELDLSHNHLSGKIPKYFSSWPYLSNLNLSFNNLEGEVPTDGIFSNTSVVSVVGNNKLCGGVFQLHLQRCPSTKVSKRRRLSLAVIVIICVACSLIGVLSVALCFYLLCYQRRRKDASSDFENIKPFLKVSYQMLSRATNGFSSSNLIGVGGFGSVYKGILHQNDAELVVAVKVMKLQNDGASKSFLAECKALRNIRHRNLVKIITACSSIDTLRNDFKALIYEFMPRGSLEGWLYPNHVSDEHVDDDQAGKLSLFQRLNIAIDVASALEYLHIECANPIIHCDLKPSNILLDDDMTARIGDFGLAKFRLAGASTSGTTNQTSSNQVRGTVGYAAPEYGVGSKVSPEGDIYSFGIIVLEMMTSKKPIDPMFNNGLNLHEYSNSALPNRVMEIIDQIMLGDTNVQHPRTGGDIRKIECIKSLIMVGVQCSMEIPHERMSISNALNELKSARRNFLSGGPNNQITLES